MICHLIECILDYGPLHEFWLFPFERLNGVLGQLPNNKKLIEVQLLKRFMNDQLVIKIPRPTEFQEDFDEFFTNEATLVYSVGNTFNPFVAWPPIDIGHDVPHNWTINELKSVVLLLKHRMSRAFSDPEVLNLIKLYSNLYSLSSSYIEVTSSFLKYHNSIPYSGKFSHGANFLHISHESLYAKIKNEKFMRMRRHVRM